MNPFKVGDIVLYKPKIPKKIFLKYDKKLGEKIGKRGKIVGFLRNDVHASLGYGLMAVVKFRNKDEEQILIKNLRLIKQAPRHPLTTIFA